MRLVCVAKYVVDCRRLVLLRISVFHDKYDLSADCVVCLVRSRVHYDEANPILATSTVYFYSLAERSMTVIVYANAYEGLCRLPRMGMNREQVQCLNNWSFDLSLTL